MEAETHGRTYFVSDLHLGAYPDVEKKSVPLLMNFFDHIERQKARLYIVGDLLDFWFEYRTVVPRYPFKLLSRLRAMVENGCKIVYVAGNHDYWMGNFLKEDVGLDTEPESLDTHLEGKRFFISHGDGIATTGELGYRFLKGMLHSRIVSTCFRLLHPDIGMALANIISKMSRRRSSKNNNQPNLEAFIRAKAAEGFDYVVLGHLHRPKLFEVGKATCLVIGDWIDNYSYGIFENGRLKLERWDLPRNDGPPGSTCSPQVMGKAKQY